MRLEPHSLYADRFEHDERRKKEAVWRVLCEEFFPQLIPAGSVVLDLGAGYCEFINHISAARRIAVDADPAVKQFAAPGVDTHVRSVQDLTFLADETVDVVFSSNLFEHMPDKGSLLAFVIEIARVLRPGGRLLVLGPNIRVLPGKYWDYFDHHIPLTEKSVQELLQLANLQVERVIPRFLPYTVKSRLPAWRWLVKAYLRLGRTAWFFFGKQFFVVARKRVDSSCRPLP